MPDPAWGRVGASNYPDKPVRLVVPFAPGGTDIIARLVGQKLVGVWGQQFVIDNRPGAGGAVGTEMVARAAPDGYTLLLTNPGPSIYNVLLRKKPPYAVSDFAPIVYIGYAPLIVVANPKFTPNNVSELIAYAKTNPDKVSWGSAGANSNTHAALELLKAATGVNIVHVPYKGMGPSLIDVVAGQIDAMYTTIMAAGAHIKSGRLKILGAAGAKRQALIPEVPTLAEQGINGADAIVWIGLVTAAKTPRPIIDKLNREVNNVLQIPDVRQRLEQLGIEIEGGTPEKFSAFIKAEVEGLTRLIKAGAVRIE
jgi:tripartite-type tricarboxylate transporter receptor subunit TctC